MATFLTLIENLLRVVFLVFFVWLFWKLGTTRDRKKKSLRDEYRPLDRFTVSKYLAGLPNVTHGISLECWVTADQFLFVFGRYKVVDAIPRNAVTSVIVDKKSQITQRLTATRMLTLGVFALAAPKKNKNETYCLGIDWTAGNGLAMSTVFEFEGYGAQAKANEAAGLFQKYVMARPQPHQRSETQCPHCAETILAEARVCKHCGRDVHTGPKALL